MRPAHSHILEQVFRYLQDTGQYFLASFITMALYSQFYSYSVESVEPFEARSERQKLNRSVQFFLYLLVFTFKNYMIFQGLYLLTFYILFRPTYLVILSDLKYFFYFPSCVFTSCSHSHAKCRLYSTFLLELPLFLDFCLSSFILPFMPSFFLFCSLFLTCFPVHFLPSFTFLLSLSHFIIFSISFSCVIS